MNKRKKAAPAAQSLNAQGKDKQLDRETQLRLVRNAFKEYPKTMRQVAEELFEERSNICWYVGMLRDAGQIDIAYQGECDTTGHTVNYYTADPKLIKQLPAQLSLFAEEVQP